jgi:hypothetical protein
MRAVRRDLSRTRFDHSLGIRRFFADFAPWACRDEDDRRNEDDAPGSG